MFNIYFVVSFFTSIIRYLPNITFSQVNLDFILLLALRILFTPNNFSEHILYRACSVDMKKFTSFNSEIISIPKTHTSVNTLLHKKNEKKGFDFNLCFFFFLQNFNNWIFLRPFKYNSVLFFFIILYILLFICICHFSN